MASTSRQENSSNSSNQVDGKEKGLLHDFSTALNTTKKLEQAVTGIFQYLCDWKSGESEKSVLTFKQKLRGIQAVQSDLEKLSSGWEKRNDQHSLALGSNGYVGIDPKEDKSAFHQQLVSSQLWIKSLNEKSELFQRGMKRSLQCENISSTKEHRKKQLLYTESSLVSELKASLPDLELKDISTKSAIAMEVVIPSVLNAYIIFSATSIDRIVVFSCDEATPQHDLWMSSKHILFKKVTDVCQSSVLHFYSLTSMKQSAETFLEWFSSYKTLFSAKCAKCQHRFNKNSCSEDRTLPPFHRDLQTRLPYHPECNIH